MEDYSLLCPICIETFRSPRLFKECGHSFCEQCLFTYVTALKDKRELGSTFPCPVCRQEVPAPSDKDVSMAWVETFPANADLIEKLSKIQTKKDDEIEKEPTIFCDPCSVENEQNRAIKFCTNCQEHLCKDCISVHRKFKVFHGHKLSEITNVKQFNKLADLTVTTCEKHTDRDIEVYCQRHDVYCCFKCLKTDHKECTGMMKEICEMETTAQTIMNAFQKKLEIAEKHIENMVLSIKTIISDGHRNGQKVIDMLKEYQDKIVSALDDMIKNVVSQTKQQLLVFEDEVAGQIVEMEEMKVRCQNLKETIDVVSVYGLPVHKVLTQKSISKEYFKIEKDIYTEENKMGVIHFEFEGQHRLHRLYSELTKCKEEQVIVVRQPSGFLRYDEVVYMTTLNTNIKTEVHSVMLGFNYFTYTGLTVVNNTHLFLCANSMVGRGGYVCLYDITNNTAMTLEMNRPLSAAVLKYNTSNVAVSVPADKKIHIVSIKGETMTTEKTFECDKQPYSLISLDNGHVGVTWDNPISFDIVDLSGNEIKTVKTFTMDSTGRTFNYFQYVAVDELRSHIVQPCKVGNAVYCFDYSGNPVFEYKDQELRSPCGVDIDNNGLIYVCSSDNNNIHVLSPSGRKLKIFKGLGKCLAAICFDKIGERICFTVNAAASNIFETSSVHIMSFNS